MPGTLAAINPATIIWIAAALGLLLVGGVVSVVFVRKWYKSDDAVTAAPDFTLNQLKEMRDQQQISPEEFEILKQQIIRQCR